jgi:hypothetical protein
LRRRYAGRTKNTMHAARRLLGAGAPIQYHNIRPALTPSP